MFEDSMGAEFSPCRTWRYRLWRLWDTGKPRCMFLMLNPSTANETTNDPTVERCQRYSVAWGYGGLYVCNLFGFRATEPSVMKSVNDPVGPGNDEAILNTAKQAGIVVLAWGNHGEHQERADYVLNMLTNNNIALTCLTITQHGHPGHPLYLSKKLKPIPFLDRNIGRT